MTVAILNQSAHDLFMQIMDVDVIIADPPYNIGYQYPDYHDDLPPENYLRWCEDWMSLAYHRLKFGGCFWLFISDEYAAQLKLLAEEVGFTLRSWNIWYYSFGPNVKNNFVKSHVHVFYFVKGEGFTFNPIPVPSARQTIYNDKRASNKKMPDNVWTPPPDDPDSTIWNIPRVAGTFKESQGYANQLPESIIERILLYTSKENDLVVDPFCGSGTTAAVCYKLRRRCVTGDISPTALEIAKKRLEHVKKLLG